MAFCGECGTDLKKQELIEYLERCVDLEKQKFVQEQTLKALDDKIKNYGEPRAFQLPIKNNKNTFFDFKAVSEGWSFGLFLGFVFFCIGLAINYKSVIDQLALLLIGMPIALGLLFAAGIIIYQFFIVAYDRIKRKKKYHSDRKVYKHNLRTDRQRVHAELSQRPFLISEKEKLEQQHQKTINVLKDFYSLNILYKKYQNMKNSYSFIAVSSFLDYIKSGMCSTLEERNGGDGAYNKFEDLYIRNEIKCTLDKILANLESVRENQWTIYNAICEGNAISARLVEITTHIASSTDQIAESSEIAAYCSQQSANELNQIKWIELYNMR